VPIPGRVVAVLATEGDAVCEGQKLVVIAAMMERTLAAPIDGCLGAVTCAVGGRAGVGDPSQRHAVTGEPSHCVVC